MSNAIITKKMVGNIPAKSVGGRGHSVPIDWKYLDPVPLGRIFGNLFFAVAPFLNNSLLLADLSLSGIVSSTYGVCLSSEDCQGKDNNKITGFSGAFYSWNSGCCPPNSPRIPEFQIK